MEAEHRSNTLINTITTTKLVLYTVLEYLNPQELLALYEALKADLHGRYTALFAVLQAYLYIRQHMTGTDRSYYFSAYNDPKFLSIQKHLFAYLSQSMSTFKVLFKCRQHNNQILASTLTLAQCPQAADQIQRLADDPQITLLKMVRETVGVGCSTIFQNFLVSKGQQLFPDVFDEYPNLSEFYQTKTNQTYIKHFFKVGHSKGKHADCKKIKGLRLAAHLIKYDQFHKYELPGNQLHNLIVILFVIADEMVEAAVCYISSIQDPYYKLLQFCLRYSLYRNFVLNIQVKNLSISGIYKLTQQKFSFAFQCYSSLYQETFEFEKVKIPQFTFWRSALGKWASSMSQFHDQFTQIYNNRGLKMRKKHMQTILQNLNQQQRPMSFITVCNKIQQLQIDEICKIQPPSDNQIEALLQNQINICLYEFSQYLMDISIDEVTVHWCGHTQQKIAEPFCQFQLQVMLCNNEFYHCLTNLVQDKKLLSVLLNADVKNIRCENYYKQKIYAQIYLQSKKILNQLNIQDIKINYQYETLDQNIQYYNGKAKIPKQVEDEIARQFYRIVPMSLDEISKYIQKETIDTLENSVCSYMQNQNEYISDNEEQSMQDELGISQKVKIFMEDQKIEVIQQKIQSDKKINVIQYNQNIANLDKSKCNEN